MVSERLGHSSIRMTADRYGHLFPRGDDTAELAIADARFFGNVSSPRPSTATVTALKPNAQTVPVEEPLSAVPPPVVATDPEREHSASLIPMILADPAISTRELVSKTGASPLAIRRARAALKSQFDDAAVLVGGRSALGQFLPGPRPTASMARVEAAVLANPGLSAQTLANKIGVGKTSVKRARKRLQSKLGANPVSTENRSTLGQFLPGLRDHPRMDQAKAAVLAHPGLSARALAKKIGISKQTVLHAQKALQNQSGENPVSGGGE